jgi:hypothetical protein
LNLIAIDQLGFYVLRMQMIEQTADHYSAKQLRKLGPFGMAKELAPYKSNF